MKRIFSKIACFFAALAVGFCFTACDGDVDDLEKRMDTLESRVKALETQIVALNSNISSLSALTSAGTINSATEKNGVWTIVLSNGQEITLNQGTIGVGNIPVMSIDKDGYWMVDYQDGKGKTYVLSNGSKVKATGDDGTTPLFSVNAAGNWTVSYDNGTSYSEVLGANGKPVSALPEGEVGDQYFKSVTYESGIFTLVLKDGTSLTVPVISSFLCSIEGADAIQTFKSGEIKTFNVTLKGVSQTVVSAPYGWKASLTDAVLSVTAPSTVLTKSTLADTDSDVTILALSGSGYATLAKIRVGLEDAPVIVNPAATITPGEATSSSLSFSVTLSDAVSWKYAVLKSSETAPTAISIKESGTLGEGTSATVSSLEASSSYTIYVLPLNGDVLGEVVSASMTTTAEIISDYYKAYTDGKDITVAGVTYNQTANGPATLLSATEADTDLKTSIHQKSGMFFLDAGDGALFTTASITEIKGDVVLIGRYVDKPATIKPAVFSKLISGKLVCKNLILDLSGIDGSGSNNKYLFTNANGAEDISAFHFEDCSFKFVEKPLIYASLASRGFKSTKILNCKLQITSTVSLQLLNFYKSTSLDTYKEFAFDNNVVFNASSVAIQICNTDHNVAQSGTTWELKGSISNNVFYNCPSSNGYFKFFRVGSLSVEKNVFWGDPASELDSKCFFLYGTGQTGTGISTSDNISYGLTKNWQYAVSTSQFVPENNIITKLDADPFTSFDSATGAYVLSGTYAGYGPLK